MTKSLTLGIPLRNEEGNVGPFIEALKAATGRLPADLALETIFCLNGSTDNTEQILSVSLAELHRRGLNPRLITSSEGKFAAQNAIALKRQHQGPLCFLDADTIMDSDCLRLLWERLAIDDAIQIVYARVVPDVGQRGSAAQRFQLMHYAVRDLVYKRRYFHGRTFMVRSWDVPDFENAAWQTERQKLVIQSSPRSLRLSRGPQIDDVFLSREIGHRFGLDAIVEVPEARVRFVPPATFQDFYLGHRRLWIEIHRLNLLFDEHRYLQATHFEQRVNRERWKQLSLRQRSQYVAYKTAEGLAKQLVRFEIRLAEWGVLELRPQWPVLTSTKSFTALRGRPSIQGTAGLSAKLPYKRTA